MTLDKVRKLCRAYPFRPFLIHLTEGRKIPVLHPEFMAHAPRGRTPAVCQPNDDFDIIDLQLVTDLEIKGNGRRTGKARRRKS
jgi:hypothetical protein